MMSTKCSGAYGYPIFDAYWIHCQMRILQSHLVQLMLHSFGRGPCERWPYHDDLYRCSLQVFKLKSVSASFMRTFPGIVSRTFSNWLGLKLVDINI